MKIIDENGATIENPDLTLGYLVDDSVPAQSTWTEQVPVQRYIRYTEEELAAREKERQQAEEAARLPETIASLTCQLTDLQLALCELYEGGSV